MFVSTYRHLRNYVRGSLSLLVKLQKPTKFVGEVSFFDVHFSLFSVLVHVFVPR